VAAVIALPLLAPNGSASAATPPTTTESHVSDQSGWVKDTIHDLDVFAPDAASVYYIGGYGTKSGARTVISGRVPEARYWSFTAYPNKEHAHDTEIRSPSGTYRITLAASCTGIKGSCLNTGTANSAGVLVYRLYLPIDLKRSGSGGVLPPRITYQGSAGGSLNLTQASASPTLARQIAALQGREGTLPRQLTTSYPPPTPVASPVIIPLLRPALGGSGPYANPDNRY
jgi:hypothetical protein